MQSRLLGLTSKTFAFLGTSVLLVGCASSETQVTAPGIRGISAPQSAAVVSVVHGARRVAPDGIIYTPADVTIENSSYNLDLNNDGTTDFTITETNSHSMGCGGHTDYSGSLSVANGQSGGGVDADSLGDANALAAGSPIGHAQGFLSGTVNMEQDFISWFGFRCSKYSFYRGNWYNVTAYLGLAFPIRGKTHYGWAQLDVTSLPSNPYWLTATLTGYAYQTKAGKSINAGQK